MVSEYNGLRVMMGFHLILFWIGFSFIYVNSMENDRKGLKLLSRQRRYISFPEGSSFSAAGCVTLGVIGQPAPSTTPGVFTFGLNFGLAYELPNATMTLQALYRFKGRKKPTIQRRNRRELYGKLESLIDKMGYNGRTCILKTLCETAQRIMPKGTNVIEEIFRTIFTLPITRKVASSTMSEYAIYEAAHLLGASMQNCDRLYNKCPLSLVDLVKGYYNARSPKSIDMLNPVNLFKSF